MSQENVELIQAFIEAYNAGEIDVTMDLCAVDVEAFPDASVFPETRPLVGRDEFGAFLKETRSAWVAARAVTKEALNADPDRVLVRTDWGGEGISSGVETYSNLSAIYTIRDGQISRADYFFDHDKALKAAGLEE